MQNKTALLAKTQLQQVNNIRENIHKFDRKINQTNCQFYMYLWSKLRELFDRTYSAIKNHHLAIKMLARYFSFHTTNMQKYIDFYRQYAVTLDAFLSTSGYPSWKEFYLHPLLILLLYRHILPP